MPIQLTKPAITWYLKADKTNINTADNYTEYDQFDDRYLISSAIIEDILECLNNMHYEMIKYEFINHHSHCAKWCILFETDDRTSDYSDFRKRNMEKLIKFKSGRFTTSSIYVKCVSEFDCDEDDDKGDDNGEDDSDDDSDIWEKIY